MRHILLLVTIALASAGASAHEGHDHAAEPTAPRAAAAPRAEGATPDFEVVAVLEGERLVVHLDRYATNEPVVGAQVEVDSGPFGAAAAAAGDGVYVVERAPFRAPGVYPLVFTVRAGDATDLLHGLLEVPPQVDETASRTRSAGPWALASGGLVAAGVAGWAWKRRNRPQQGA